MFTSRLLQVYAFLIPLELILGKLFGVDTIWKPYRIAAILVAVVAMIELPYRRFDRYDRMFLVIFLIGCGLSFIWVIVGTLDEPIFVLRACIFVLIPLVMYFCIKLSVTSSEDLKRLIGAFVLGTVVDACYVTYEALILGNTDRPAGLSGQAAENSALHCGLAMAFILYPYRDRGRATWLSIVLRVGAGAVVCFAVIASGTRAAWMGLGLSTAALSSVMALSRFQRGRLLKALVPTAVLVLAAVFFSEPLSKTGNGKLVKDVEGRLLAGDLKTGAGRTEIWEHAVDVASGYYFLGGGFSGFMQGTYQRRRTFHLFTPIGLEHGVASHNVFLEVLIDYGPISLLMFIACITTLVGTVFRKACNARRDLSAHGMLYALIFLMVCGLFRDLTGNPDFWAVMAFITVFIRRQPCPAIMRTGPVRF